MNPNGSHTDRLLVIEDDQVMAEAIKSYLTTKGFDVSLAFDGKEGLKTKSGFLNYGNIREDFIIIKGSVPGSAKRLVRMRLAVNPKVTVPNQAPDIISVDGAING